MSQGCEAEHLCLGSGWEGGLALGKEIFFPQGDGGGSGSRGIPYSLFPLYSLSFYDDMSF